MNCLKSHRSLQQIQHRLDTWPTTEGHIFPKKSTFSKTTDFHHFFVVDNCKSNLGEESQEVISTVLSVICTSFK